MGLNKNVFKCLFFYRGLHVFPELTEAYSFAIGFCLSVAMLMRSKSWSKFVLHFRFLIITILTIALTRKMSLILNFLKLLKWINKKAIILRVSGQNTQCDKIPKYSQSFILTLKLPERLLGITFRECTWLYPEGHSHASAARGTW